MDQDSEAPLNLKSCMESGMSTPDVESRYETLEREVMETLSEIQNTETELNSRKLFKPNNLI